MIQKGTLPNPGIIKIDTKDPRIQLFENDLIKDLVIDGIIESQPNKKKITISVIKITDLGKENVISNVSGDHALLVAKLLGVGHDSGFKRSIDNFLNVFILPKCKLFLGTVGEKKIPIVIFYSWELDKGSYSLKKNDELPQAFHHLLN